MALLSDELFVEVDGLMGCNRRTGQLWSVEEFARPSGGECVEWREK